MREVLAAAQAQREKRTALLEVPMIWIEARDRATDAIHGIGFWQGEAVEAIWVTDMFTGAAAQRTFYNQGILEIGSVRNETGFGVKAVAVSLSAISPAVEQAFRGYDPRGCQVQVWKRSYNPDTRKPLGVEPFFKGFVNTAPITRPEPGGEATIEVEIVSTARMLTIASGVKKSHQAQLARAPADKFRQYKAKAKTFDCAWGMKDG